MQSLSNRKYAAPSMPTLRANVEQAVVSPSLFLKARLWIPLLGILRQGITPEKMALCIALGFVLGVTPVLGLSSFLCLGAAFVLRLNAPAIQFVNYLVYPLQFVLFMPFIRIGESIFAAAPIKLSVAGIMSLIRQNAWTAMGTLWTATLHAVVAWLALGSLAALSFYLLLVPALRRLAGSMQPEVPQ